MKIGYNEQQTTTTKKKEKQETCTFFLIFGIMSILTFTSLKDVLNVLCDITRDTETMVIF